MRFERACSQGRAWRPCATLASPCDARLVVGWSLLVRPAGGCSRVMDAGKARALGPSRVGSAQWAGVGWTGALGRCNTPVPLTAGYPQGAKHTETVLNRTITTHINLSILGRVKCRFVSARAFVCRFVSCRASFRAFCVSWRLWVIVFVVRYGVMAEGRQAPERFVGVGLGV